MLKTIILVFAAILMAVNLVLMWQIFRNLKRSRDERTVVSERYHLIRITFISLNTVIVCIINIVFTVMRSPG